MRREGIRRTKIRRIKAIPSGRGYELVHQCRFRKETGRINNCGSGRFICKQCGEQWVQKQIWPLPDSLRARLLNQVRATRAWLWE